MKLHSQGKLFSKVNVIVPEALLEKVKPFKSTNNAKLRFGGVMIVIDGYLDSKTAALLQPYSDEPNNCGKLFCTDQVLAASVTRVLDAGFQPLLQAMGDKAVEMALKVIEQSSVKNARFRIEQAALLNEKLIERLKRQNLVITIQPRVIVTEFSVWSATRHLGVKRASWLHPLKTLIESKIKVAGGSDCPMEPLNPILGIKDLVLRENFPEQRISVQEALNLYTIDAAYCSCEEEIKGSIEEGKLADLTILSEDPLTIPLNRIKKVSVEMTIVDGQIIFTKPN